MTERFTIKPQDDLFGVVDNYSADKVCVVNGIRTEIEAKWLCNVLNDLNDENEQLKKELDKLKVVNEMLSIDFSNSEHELWRENEQLKQSNERIVKDIELALGFIRHNGYSLQDIKDYEDAKKEYEEDLAYYRKGDVE